MRPSLDRRQFLRAAGTVLALPALQSLGFKAFAAEKTPPPPKRMIFLGFGWGVTNETWFPSTDQVGADYALPVGLAPLARHKDGFTIVQGLSNKFSNEAHWGSTFWLTGANRYAEPGQSFHNGISADQVAAARLGAETRFGSLRFDCADAAGDGHGPGAMSWDARGKPLNGLENPVVAYHRLFSDDATPLDRRQAMLAEQRSILDAVREDAGRVRRGLSRHDADKLDEYFQGIRDLETRLSKDEQWLGRPKAKAPLPEPRPGLAGKEEIRMMYELMVAALRTDSTRVLTYRLPTNSLLKSLDVKVAPHDMSHYAPGERMEASQKRDTEHSRLLAGFFDQLKAVKEADGSSLFDHTTVAVGSNIRTIHYLDNCPTLVAGGGAGIRLGRHVVLQGKNTPLANLWLTLLQGSGVRAESHGDSNGVIKEVLA